MLQVCLKLATNHSVSHHHHSSILGYLVLGPVLLYVSIFYAHIHHIPLSQAHIKVHIGKAQRVNSFYHLSHIHQGRISRHILLPTTCFRDMRIKFAYLYITEICHPYDLTGFENLVELKQLATMLKTVRHTSIDLMPDLKSLS